MHSQPAYAKKMLQIGELKKGERMFDLGSGDGRIVIMAARKFGARKLVLLSASRLQAAVHLYERLGFRHEPLPSSNPYATADVYMVLDL